MIKEACPRRQREDMVREQIEARGVRDRHLLDAMRKIPRELFVPAEFKAGAYNDHPIPIGEGQTVSQPYMAALMTQAAALKPGAKVLEAGTGSGYQTAILAELSSEVYTVERIPALAKKAKETLDALGYINIRLKTGDGSCGWREHAPFDGIIVTCGAPSIPIPLKEQLADDGRLIIPVGSALSQALMLVTREKGGFKERVLSDCVFVPLIGKYGWDK